MSRYTFWDIFVWVLIFVVGSLIVSFLIYPSSFQSFKSNVKDIFSSNSLNSVDISKNPQPQSSFLVSCQSEMKEKTRMAEERSLLNLNVDIREYKEFDDTYSAVQYLREWGIIGDRVTGYNLYPDLFESNLGKTVYDIDLNKEEDMQYIISYNDIIVFLARFEYTNGVENYKVLLPIICVDGELTEKSIWRFNTA